MGKYKLKFVLDTARTGQLIIGTLTLYQDGSNINSFKATSSYPQNQYDGTWNKIGGLIPPTTEVIKHTGSGLSVATTPLILDVKGVNGEFYPISPYNMDTDDANRGDWGIHRDIDPRPGTMGCIGIKTEPGMQALIREMRLIASVGIKSIELEVVYL